MSDFPKQVLAIKLGLISQHIFLILQDTYSLTSVLLMLKNKSEEILDVSGTCFDVFKLKK